MASMKWKLVLTRLVARVSLSSPRVLPPPPPRIEKTVFLSSIRHFSKKVKAWRPGDKKYIKKQAKKTWNRKEEIILRCDSCVFTFGTTEELDKHKKLVHGDNVKTEKGKRVWKTAEGEVRSDLRKYRSVIDVKYDNDEGEKDAGDDEGEQDVHNDEGKKDLESDDGRSFDDEPPEEARLFVGNLPYQLDKDQLAKFFEGAGVVQTSEVVYDKFTNRSRGFGFVTMVTVEEANKATEMFHGSVLYERRLAVNKAAPKVRIQRPLDSSFRAFVCNLPWEVDGPRLKELFSQHGRVLDARVAYYRGKSRGFGFVSMSTVSELNNAITALDGKCLDGRAIKVDVAVKAFRRSWSEDF